MTTTLHAPDPVQPTGRRTGATWVAATGAFLLLAGAAVFVAVRWDRLPESAKLAIVLAVTGAFLAGGRVLRRTLPATGDVLFHLGAFLMPIDLAGIGLRSGMGWRPLLVAEGVLGIVVLGGMGLATGSVVLTWAGTASVAVLAAGIASVSPVPAPLVLVAAAVAAELSGHRGLRAVACLWAAAAGLAPVLGAAVTVFLGVGDGTLADLGLAGTVGLAGTAGTAAAVSVVSGTLAAAVLARHARRHDDLRLAFLALASFGIGLVSGWAGAGLGVSTGAVGVAAVFVVVELAALLAVGDPFWRAPLARLAELAEVGAMIVSIYAGALLLGAPFAGRFATHPALGSALALVAIGLLAADIRRYEGTPRPFALTLLRGGSWAPATVPIALAAVVAVEVGTASTMATAVALLVVAALAAWSDRPSAEVVVAGFSPWAVVAVAGHPALAAVAGLAGGALVAETAVRRARHAGPAVVEAVLAVVAAGTVLLGLAIAAPVLGAAAAIGAAIPACWLLAFQLERGGNTLGDVARVAMLAPVFGALDLAPAQAVPLLLAAGVLYAADAIRLARPDIGIGAALTVQFLVVQVALGAGISGPAVGVALCVAAVAWAGLAVVVEADWRRPFLVAAGSGLAFGLAIASTDQATFANALLIAGGLVLGAGLAGRRAGVAHLGGALCTAALAIHLSVAGVTASEPYAAPVAAQLLVAGWMARRRPSPALVTSREVVTSWAAYVPSVALLGGAAFAERLAGGAGWHALVAGAVGVVAVAAGGGRRLAGPMLTGTALLVGVTGYESLGALAGVPTWAWLTIGGSLLLAAGVALERNDTSPVEAGRRIVDVVAERFG
jgi:hypothetical protein